VSHIQGGTKAAGVRACDAGKISVRKREEVQAAGDDCTVRNSMICSPHQIILDFSNSGGCDGRGIFAYVEQKRITSKLLMENLKSASKT